MIGPLNADETALLATFRDSLANDRVLLCSLLTTWPRLSPAQRAAIYRTADLFTSKAAWKGPVEPEPGEKGWP